MKMDSPPSLITYSARDNGASHQELLPGRYKGWVMVLSMAAFMLAFLGWLNESWLYLYESPIWLNRYTEYAIILGFGVWRIASEQNAYTRKRLIILVTVVTLFWWLIPWLLPQFEPYIGYVWSQPVFPALHTPGTLTFFLVLLLVYFFGRRVICGFGCPCVGIRETVGFSFRRFSLRGEWAWRLRHSKWFFFLWYVGVMVATQFPPNSWTVTLVGLFGMVVGLTYFGSFFIIPFTGNRFYCRFLCPFGATFGLLNHAGHYSIELDREQCVDCRRCDQVCDMGIPVWKQGQQTGAVTGLEDCMGCARCITSCPTDALEIRDIRNRFQPTLHQNASYLLKREPNEPLPRIAPVPRSLAQRMGDWEETEQPLSMDELQQQAQRCLDCGMPGCRNGCPLGNFIPDWLEAAAKGDWIEAGDLVHATSPLPEVCGTICPQHRLCEGGCTRGRLEGAVTIGAIESGIAKQALSAGWSLPQPKHRTKQSAAIIGAGPAGLACAQYLNQRGVAVTIYEQSTKIGGLLQSGVPSFKLDKGLLEQRKALFEQAGIHFSLGVPVDGEKLSALLEEHDLLFLGLGAQKSCTIELPGQNLRGVSQALDWLTTVNVGVEESLSGLNVVVVGGGDSAMDCARAALRLGAKVTIAYRGAETGLRASPKEVTLAREEGVQFLFEYRPLQVQGSGTVSAVDFDTASGVSTVEADRVILALGQRPNPPVWLADFGIETDLEGCIQVDQQGGTSHPKIWAGGDNTHGPDLAVTAMAAGRRAAEGMLTVSQKMRRRG